MTEFEFEALAQFKKIVGLLELLAEENIALRDSKMRAALRDIVGNSPKKQASVLAMDGTRNQTDIRKLTTIDQGDLSKMVGQLEKANLLVGGKKNPELGIVVPNTFFEANAKAK